MGSSIKVVFTFPHFPQKANELVIKIDSCILSTIQNIPTTKQKKNNSFLYNHPIPGLQSKTRRYTNT